MRPILLVLASALLALTGCGGDLRQASPEANTSYELDGSTGGTLAGSLFPADTQALGNEAIEHILAGKPEFHPEGRMAVLPIGGWNYQETGELGRYLATIASALSPSPLVGEVVQIPRVLVPRQVTVPVLREIGARLQCEFVLVYAIGIDMHYRANLFTKDESRNRVTVEAILLHVRTGLIPVAVIKDQTIDATQAKGEDSYEFIRRLQRDTALTALHAAAVGIRERLP